MDAQRFDGLARALARQTSRRAVLRGAAGGAVAGMLVGAGVRPAGAQCAEGQTDCNGTCVDLQTDDLHCGACDAVCESDLVAVNCIAGVCTRVSCPAAVPTYCGELGENDPNYEANCVDTTTDPNNCGDCGIVCDSGVCEDSACVEDEGCDAGLTDCGGVCVDLATDMDNCGECGAICESDLVGVACIEGECVRTSCPAALPDSCGDPNRPVEEHCFDLSSDPNNCGECGVICESGVCSVGACAPVDGGDDGGDGGGTANGTTELPNTGSGAAAEQPWSGWAPTALVAAAALGAAAVRRVAPGSRGSKS